MKEHEEIIIKNKIIECIDKNISFDGISQEEKISKQIKATSEIFDICFPNQTSDLDKKVVHCL